MNMIAERQQKEIYYCDDITQQQKKFNVNAIGDKLSDLPLIQLLKKRLDGVENMAPIFYFLNKDTEAKTLAQVYVPKEMRLIYKCEKSYCCMFDRRIFFNDYEYLHLYFRKNELLAVHCNDWERDRYFGVSIPRESEGGQSDEWEFRRNQKVETVSMDLKLGIYDVRFELFFKAIFDFYKFSGLDW